MSCTLRLKIASQSPAPIFSFPLCDSLSGQKCVSLYNPVIVGREGIFKYVCILNPYKYEGKSISDSARLQKDVHAEMNYYAGLLEN